MKLILASNSPRRKELLAGLDVDFEVKVLKDIDESYPEDLPVDEVALYISKAKAEAYRNVITDEQLVITADTVVVLHNRVLGKPENREDAIEMLHALSGQTHKVITGVCLTSLKGQRAFSVTTEVSFKTLSDAEIEYYVDVYKPFDKAGAYGIQEWIGYVGVTGLKGSYFNVMGLPVQRIYQELVALCGDNSFIRGGRARL